MIGPATAKCGSFAITVNGRGTIGVIVAVDLERVAREMSYDGLNRQIARRISD